MILLLSGSSSCGKNTIIKNLIAKNDKLKYIHTFTSREKREGESDGNPYFFISKEEFQNKIKNNDFYEHELIHNNFYGVEKQFCQNLLNEGSHLLKDMGVMGTFNLKEKLSENLVETLFLYVDKRTLKKRLIKRGDTKDIKTRLKRFKFEASYIKKYNYVIHNRNLETTLKIVEKILENNAEFYNYILPLQKINKININKVKKYCDMLINNKNFKPLKVYFNGENFYLTKELEKYLASIITNKNITKHLIYKEIKVKDCETIENIKKFISSNQLI